MYLLLLTFAISPAFLYAKSLPSITWQSTSPPSERYATIGDTLDIFCPSYSEETHASETEQSIIYRVTESEYNSCTVGKAARELGRCTSPYKQDKIKVAFRLFSPNPSALEYRPATTYYFISTASGTKEGLHQKNGGLCETHNLKMIIHIAGKESSGKHHHRHPPAAASESTETSTSDPLLNQMIDKISVVNQTPVRDVSRAERVNLNDAELQMLNSAPGEDAIQYQIHEVGDSDSWSTEPSSSRSILDASAFCFVVIVLMR